MNTVSKWGFGVLPLITSLVLVACTNGASNSADPAVGAPANPPAGAPVNPPADPGKGDTPEVDVAASGLEVVELVKVSEAQVSDNVFDETYQVRMRNAGGTAYNDVALILTAAGTGSSIMDGEVTLGAVPAGAKVLATDTVTVRRDRKQPLNPAALVWRTAQNFTLAYKAAPADNPLKGLVPYQHSGKNTSPHSMEWFHLPVNAVMKKGPNEFDWTELDNRLEQIKSRGHQAVFSFYLDYPNREYGVPAFLSGVKKYSYTAHGNGSKNTSYSPDYTDPALIQAIRDFIKALGTKYDTDPRVAFVSVGLLGFWGEWHTFVSKDDPSPRPPKPGTDLMKIVLDDYQTFFPSKFVLAREPKDPVIGNDRPRMGFSDGAFAFETTGPTSWHFWPTITKAGLADVWKTRPIGGEVFPGVQKCIWDDVTCAPAGQDFNRSVQTTHASWLVYNRTSATGADALGPAQLQRAVEGARSLGYTLHVSKARVELPALGQPLRGSVSLENRGVAPFYYPWTVRIGAVDGAGNLVASWPMTWDIRTVKPDAPQTWVFDVAKPGLAAGAYTLVMGVANPMDGGKPVKFGNVTQDATRGGWLTLGAFKVRP